MSYYKGEKTVKIAPCRALIHLNHLKRFISSKKTKYIIILDDIESFKHSPNAQEWFGTFLNLTKETFAGRLNA